MESTDPPGPEPRGSDVHPPDTRAVPPAGSGPSSGRPEPEEDVLRRLEQRLDRASDAAERLIAEAAANAGRRPPPAGWQMPADPSGNRAGDGRAAGEIELLAQALQALRNLIPPELQRRIAEALRELLLALRALIDWYLERSEHQRAQPTEVQDIPIL
jgi:hypothetical protein